MGLKGERERETFFPLGTVLSCSRLNLSKLQGKLSECAHPHPHLHERLIYMIALSLSQLSRHGFVRETLFLRESVSFSHSRSTNEQLLPRLSQARRWRNLNFLTVRAEALRRQGETLHAVTYFSLSCPRDWQATDGTERNAT